MASPVEEVPFTELIQHPAKTAKLLEEGAREVRLRRRNADDLVLMALERAKQEAEIVGLTGKLLARLLLPLHNGAETIRVILREFFPWLRFLPPDGQDEFAQEFAEVAQASSSIENLAPLRLLVSQWKSTAEVYADPELYEALTRPTWGDHGPVVPPDIEE